MLEGKNEPYKIEALEIPLGKIPVDVMEIIMRVFRNHEYLELKG